MRVESKVVRVRGVLAERCCDAKLTDVKEAQVARNKTDGGVGGLGEKAGADGRAARAREEVGQR
jgi:hypothetical protein